MPRPKKPRAVAAITGALLKDPQRYRAPDPGADLPPLGEPPDWLREDDECRACTAWREISSMAPWLNRSHRGITGIAALVLGRFIAGQDVGVQAMNLLRQCLGSMGLNPADARRVAMPAAPTNDPADAYFT